MVDSSMSMGLTDTDSLFTDMNVLWSRRKGAQHQEGRLGRFMENAWETIADSCLKGCF